MSSRLWDTDDEYSAATSAVLPTPVDTPYRTPSSTSRRSKRSSKSPGPPSSSPPNMQNHRNSIDPANDESISILDPRRFTPTLHANLVSEILGLRRDQEEKSKLIESLESELHEARGVHESLEQTLATNGKETRSLKRQLALLEGGTSSALQELAKERDEAVDNAADIKIRLESCQKKQRLQEEDLDRTNEIYSRDKENWDAERRKYERQIHVAESRLRTVLDEVAAFQAAQQVDAEEAQELVNGHDLGNESGNDNASVRSMSITNSRTNSIRFSAMNGFGNGFKGVSLADELNLETDDDQETDYGGRESAMSNHRRRQSRDSIMSLSRTHRRNLSNESMLRSKSVNNRNRYHAFADFDSGIPEERLEETFSQPKPEYVDTGIQFSPPPSPKLEPTAAPEIPEMNRLGRSLSPVPRELEVEANQRRKRVHAPLVLEQKSHVVSAGCQTLDEPLSPPGTPESPSRAAPPPPGMGQDAKTSTASISTQTEPPPSPTRPAPQAPISIPMISIHPPESGGTLPGDSLLPAQFKDAACQVSIPLSASYCSSSMQTEEIRVDMRLDKLPPHLRPSAISSTPPTPERGESKRPSPSHFNITPVPPRNPRRNGSNFSAQSQDPPSSPPLPSPSLQETYDAYPGNNDDGPLANGKSFNIRRPHRISSLFAGFDDKSSDDGDFAEGELSDSDFRTALSPSKPPSKAGLLTVGHTSVPEDEVLSLGNPDRRLSKQSVMSDRRSSQASSMLVGVAKQATMRRAALISSGVATHANRPRSPSLEGDSHDAVPPPFPIPTRASSRQPPSGASAPSDGTTSPTPGESWSARNERGFGTGDSRNSSVRKARSAAVLPRNGRRRGSRSPPAASLLSASTEGPTSPQLPPMPNNDITSPSISRYGNGYIKKSSLHRRQQPSSNTANTETTTGGLSNSTVQSTSVVDAIAQTMVGEWMFKYVRRRKSFGVPDNSQVDENSGNGVRHKRWVWLAPYERAVMWSSKQPTSGSALLGKSGRKLTIQSVLDVKDDNPGPKNAGGQTVFNRSILILTPARALKFTAINSERHYIWLTALSFLAHSSQAVPTIQAQAPPPPIPTTAPPFEIPLKSSARLRRNPIRDSIRVAKGKTAQRQAGPKAITNDTFRSPALTEISFNSQQQTHARDDSAFSGVAVPRYGGRGDRDYRDLEKDRGYQSSYQGSSSNPSHARKRSNTVSRAPPPPPLSFRGFAGPGPMTSSSTQFSTAGLSVGTNGSSDMYSHGGGGGGSAYGGGISNGTAPTYQSSIRTLDTSASTRPGGGGGAAHQQNNFFDAVGTVRMEAFISPMALMPTGNISRFDDYMNEDPSHEGMEINLGGRDRVRDRSAVRRRKSKSRQRDNYYNNNNTRKMGGGPGSRRDNDDFYGGSKTAGEEDFRDLVYNPRDLDAWKGF